MTTQSCLHMNKNIPYPFGVIFTALVFFLLSISLPSCTKLDIVSQQKAEIQNRFFNIPANTPKDVHKVVDALRLQNNLGDFAYGFANREGYPLWDKPIIQRIKDHEVSNSFGDEELTAETLVFIPIVKQDEHFVNGFFFSRIVGDSVELRLYRGVDYNLFPFGKYDTSHVTAELITLQILLLEENVFGHRKYRLMDDRLFAKSRYDTTPASQFTTIELDTSNLTVGAKKLPMWLCGYFPGPVATSGQCHCGFECQHFNTNCMECNVYYCMDITPEPPGGGLDPYPPGWPPDPNGLPYPDPQDPPTQGGGEGGGGSNPSEGNCTGLGNCRQNSLIIEGRLPCGGCGNGPVTPLPPDEPPIQPPLSDTCEVLFNKGKKLDSLYMKGKVDSMLNTFTGWRDYTVEKGFSILADCRKVNGDTITSFYRPSDVVSGTDSSLTYVVNLNEYSPYHFELFAATAHIHLKKAYSAPSPSDIYSLIFNSMNEPRFETKFIISAHEETFALMITDKAKALTFNGTKSQYLDGIKWKEYSDIGKEFKGAEEYYMDVYKSYDAVTRRNLSYMMAMSAVLKLFNSGITLFKKDISGKFNPIFVNITVPNPSKPKKKVYINECE